MFRPEQRYAWPAFLAIFALVFVSCNAIFQSVTLDSGPILSLLFVLLFELSWLGFAYDIAELVLALVCSPQRLEREERAAPCPRVALVCCTCDDVIPETLEALTRQDYSALSTFVLDDSTTDKSMREIDASGLTVVRRPNKCGYKAGNLNHWLNAYGHLFDLLIVADADSLLPATFTSDMVSFALHPSNRDIAIFETLILPWNSDSLFTLWQRPAAAIQQSFALRVDNLIGSSMSVGHNNMYRVRAISAVRGFQERYVAEDYATCVEVIRSQWSCKTVPVVSYEKAPADLYSYCARQARWAAQTFQLGALSLDDIPWPVRLRLLRGFHHYASYPVLCWAVLLIIAVSIQPFATGETPEMSLGWSPAMALWMAVLCGPCLLRYLVARREGVSVAAYIGNVVFEATVFWASIGPIIGRLASACRQGQVEFNPTGRRSGDSRSRRFGIFVPASLAGCLGLYALLEGRISAANVVWVGPMVVFPALLILASRSRTAGPQ